MMPLTVSSAALAAEAALEAPRASITVAPRFCTLLMKSPCSQASFWMTSVAGLPSIVAWKKSGNCVAEWFPQMRDVLDAGAPAGRP